LSYGDEFQQKSKYSRDTLGGKGLDWNRKPAVYKTYPPDRERFPLESPAREGGRPLFQLLQERRSARTYTPDALSKEDLGQLLWASQGISLKARPYQLRTAPSAGALYPIETYVACHRVSGLPPGIYHYEVLEHRLAQIRPGEWGRALAQAALGQAMLMRAPAVFLWSALVARSKWKYDQRAYRYIYLDAGHIAQNLALAAVSLGLGTCQVGAFFDDEVNAVVELDGVEETVIYMSVVGAGK
jgi:SagB-type dehydrogenase family enzyme